MFKSAVAAVLALALASPTAEPDPPGAAYALSSLSVIATAPAADCGLERGCLGAEHKIDSSGALIWLGPHQCWGPASHSGPPCDPTFASIADVQSMSLYDVQAHIDSGESNLVLNERAHAVDVYSCDRTVIVGRVPMAALE